MRLIENDQVELTNRLHLAVKEKVDIEEECSVTINELNERLITYTQENIHLQDIITSLQHDLVQEQEKIRLLENEIYELTVKLDEMQNTINSISLKDFYWFGRKGIIAHVEINEGINIHCDSDDPESKKFCRNLKHALQKIIPSKARLSFKVIS